MNGATGAAATLAYDELSRRTGLTFGNGASVGYGYVSPVIDDLSSIAHNFVGSNVTFGYGFNNNHEIVGQSVTDQSYMWVPGAVSTIAYAAANAVNQYPTVNGTAYSYNGDGCSVTNDFVRWEAQTFPTLKGTNGWGTERATDWVFWDGENERRTFGEPPPEQRKLSFCNVATPSYLVGLIEEQWLPEMDPR